MISETKSVYVIGNGPSLNKIDITKLKTKTFHLWAGEFDPGSLEEFCHTMHKTDNKTLVTLDICDVSKPEPEDQILLPQIDSLIERNKKTQ